MPRGLLPPPRDRPSSHVLSKVLLSGLWRTPQQKASSGSERPRISQLSARKRASKPSSSSSQPALEEETEPRAAESTAAAVIAEASADLVALHPAKVPLIRSRSALPMRHITPGSTPTTSEGLASAEKSPSAPRRSPAERRTSEASPPTSSPTEPCRMRPMNVGASPTQRSGSPASKPATADASASSVRSSSDRASSQRPSPPGRCATRRCSPLSRPKASAAASSPGRDV